MYHFSSFFVHHKRAKINTFIVDGEDRKTHGSIIISLHNLVGKGMIIQGMTLKLVLLSGTSETTNWTT